MRVRRLYCAILVLGAITVFRPAGSSACTCAGDIPPMFLVENGSVLPANARGIISPYLSANWDVVPIMRVDRPQSQVPFKVEKIAYPEPLRKGRGGSMTFALLCPDWEPGGTYRIGARPYGVEVTISMDAFVPDTSQIDIWENEMGEVTTGGGTTCSITFDAHRLGIEMSGREVKKWGASLMYFTVVDGTVHWHPTRSYCVHAIPGRSWVGPSRDLLYSSCNGSVGAFENLSSGKHTVAMIAWLPGVGEIIAKKEVVFDCH